MITNLLEYYVKIIRKRPIVLILPFIYIGIIGSYIIVREKQNLESELSTRNILEMRNHVREVERLNRVIDSLTASRDFPTVFGHITFQEKWDDPESEAEVKRLFEYAEFASSKDDYARARALYKEAGTFQKTFEADFRLGLLSYIEHDLDVCIQRWSALVDRDAKSDFPLMRLYLGIVLHEAGDTVDSARYIKEYADSLR